ncbi:MAG: hypothetical protein SaLV5_gp2 [Sanya levivirus 5]|nr:MAG: hypothetical protein SaLV5_gp2 [Sanya levivirus 5]
MPFGTITAQAQNYEPRDDGHYVRSTVVFGAPDNSFVVRGASNPKADPIRASVSRVLQKDVVINGTTVRKTATMTISIVAPSVDFTANELDSLGQDLSDFLTPVTISRLLMGES